VPWIRKMYGWVGGWTVLVQLWNDTLGRGAATHFQSDPRAFHCYSYVFKTFSLLGTSHELFRSILIFLPGYSYTPTKSNVMASTQNNAKKHTHNLSIPSLTTSTTTNNNNILESIEVLKVVPLIRNWIFLVLY
jgi:hypothetical protein